MGTSPRHRRSRGPFVVTVRAATLMAAAATVVFGVQFATTPDSVGLGVATCSFSGGLTLLLARVSRTSVSVQEGVVIVTNPFSRQRIELSEIRSVRAASSWTSLPVLRLVGQYRYVDVFAYTDVLDDGSLERLFVADHELDERVLL